MMISRMHKMSCIQRVRTVILAAHEEDEDAMDEVEDEMMMVKTMMESIVREQSITQRLKSSTHEHIIIQIRKRKSKSNEIQDKQQVKEEDVQEEETE